MATPGLPTPARVLVAAALVVGTTLLVVGLRTAPACDPWAAFIYIGLALVASSQRVRIHPNLGTMSLGFLFVFAALFRCGSLVATSTAIVGSVSGRLFETSRGGRQKLAATGYAAGSLALAAWLAALLYERMLPGGPSQPPAQLTEQLLPAGVAVGTYYLATVVSIGLMSWAAGGAAPSRKLMGELLWMAPVYLAGGAAALAIDAAYREYGLSVFVLSVPLVYIIQRSYAARAEQLRREMAHLEERTKASEKLAEMYLSVVRAFSLAIDLKDHGTQLHNHRVHELAGEVARRVGLAGADLQAVETGSMLHDIGKLAVPDHILRKPGDLTEEEFDVVRRHPVTGEAILRPIDFGADVASIVRHHHERMDGAGYPDGLMGDEIPLGARVLGVIDVYDALISDRPYREAWTREQAQAYLRVHAGTSFDARVVEALIEALEAGFGAEPGEAEQRPGAPDLARAEDGVADPISPEERTRRLLGALVEHVVSRVPCETCAVFVVDERNAEIHAAACLGQAAERFAHLRIPIGTGPSGQAAATARPSTGLPASGDFAPLLADAPDELAECRAYALPIVTSTGTVAAVLSLYTTPAESPSPEALAEISADAAQTGRSLEIVAEHGSFTVDQRRSLVEYGAFLAALTREVAQAAETGDRLTLVAVGCNADPAAPRPLGQFRAAAAVLRECGGPGGRVLEREAAGEVLAVLTSATSDVERCLRRLGEAVLAPVDADSGGGTPRLGIGVAVFPADADSAHALITVAEMRMARAAENADPSKAARLLLST